MELKYDLGDIVQMKKPHPCRQSLEWEIIRMRADIRIKCLGCGTSVMFDRSEFERKMKKVIRRKEDVL